MPKQWSKEEEEEKEEQGDYFYVYWTHASKYTMRMY